MGRRKINEQKILKKYKRNREVKKAKKLKAEKK